MNLNREKTIKTFGVLGDCMRKWGEKADVNAFNPFVAGDFYDKVEHIIQSSKAFNGWFTEESVRESLANFGSMLTEEALTAWLAPYKVHESPKYVGLILAGNIPLVGFHDVIATLFSGHHAQIKLSSDDNRLIPVLLDIAVALQPELASHFSKVDKLNKVDAVIATGGDNTARYFEKYFGDLPHIIRKNRTSVAVLSGDETPEELRVLGKDIFTYFGLGCRNVTHLLLPEGFDLDKLFGAIIGYSEIIHHHKYANNYDYYKAIYLMNQEKIIENGFLITRETQDLFAPVAMLHYHFYKDVQEAKDYLMAHRDKIQVVVGKGYEQFGSTQLPKLNDYADNVDTLAFLTETVK